MSDGTIAFKEFRDEWLTDECACDPSTTALGHRFARKLRCQWLDIDDSSDDLGYCDGAGDGGIDIACRIAARGRMPRGRAEPRGTHGSSC